MRRNIFEVSGITIPYDANGNMISHEDKGILQIDYNFLNLPNYLLFNKNLYTHTGIIKENTNYLYRADGTKLRKTYNYIPLLGGAEELSSKITEYLDGFQYETVVKKNNTATLALQFVPTSEGYYDFQKNKYIYQYKDQIGNVRISYYKDNSNTIVVDKENNYYPFGLEHTDYNMLSGNTSYNYGFQEQEKQLDTGWSSFKWRNYNPTIGRFFNIDPLSEKYSYQSHYNFSENRVMDGRELEGLEWVKSTTLNQDGTKTYTLNADIKLVGGSKYSTAENMKNFQKSYVDRMKNSYNGLLSNGDKLEIGKINFETVDSVKDGDYSISIVDAILDSQGNPITVKDETVVRGIIQLEGKDEDPINGYIGNSQQNNMQVVYNGKTLTGEAAAHETGHTFGLRHDKDSKNPISSLIKISNLLFAPRMGNGIIPEQRDIVIQNVPDEKKK